MKLTDLEPRWIHPNMFVFRCPHCPQSGVLLSCKDIEMSLRDQMALISKEFGEEGQVVIPDMPEFSWNIVGTRPDNLNTAFIKNLTVTPSIDASKSGHWHGFITNGEIITV